MGAVHGAATTPHPPAPLDRPAPSRRVQPRGWVSTGQPAQSRANSAPCEGEPDRPLWPLCRERVQSLDLLHILSKKKMLSGSGERRRRRNCSSLRALRAAYLLSILSVYANKKSSEVLAARPRRRGKKGSHRRLLRLGYGWVSGDGAEAGPGAGAGSRQHQARGPRLPLFPKSRFR